MFSCAARQFKQRPYIHYAPCCCCMNIIQCIMHIMHQLINWLSSLFSFQNIFFIFLQQKHRFLKQMIKFSKKGKQEHQQIWKKIMYGPEQKLSFDELIRKYHCLHSISYQFHNIFSPYLRKMTTKWTHL